MNNYYFKTPKLNQAHKRGLETTSSRKTQVLITTLLSNNGESEITLTKLAVTLGSAVLPSGQWNITLESKITQEKFEYDDIKFLFTRIW